MALKAGYVGVKRWLYEKLQKTTSENVTNINGLQDNVNKNGAKNLFPPYTGTRTDGNVTFTAGADGVITCSGTATATALWRKNYTFAPGSYIISCGDNVNTSGVGDVFFALYNSGTNAYISPDEGTTDRYTFSEATTLGVTIRIGSGTVSSNYTFKPMIRLATDPDATYAPYAMTNQQLTAADIKSDTFSGTTGSTGNVRIAAASANRNVIAVKASNLLAIPYLAANGDQNAHFMDYTGATLESTAVSGTYYYLDSTATANRSAVPDERSLDVEVEEPEVVKKSTKKTTKKEVE